MGLVNQVGLGVILEAGGNLSKETLAAARNLGLLEQAGNRAGNAVAGHGRSMTRAMSGFKDALSGLPGLIASITGGISAWTAIKIPASIEHSQSKLRADLKATTGSVELAAGRFNSLISVISQLDKPLPIEQMTQGMAKLNAELGYEGARGAYPTLINIIKSGVTDIETASEALATLTEQFHETPQRVGDLLSRTATNAKADLQELLIFMKNNAALIANMGWSIEDAFGTMGVLASKGLRGAKPGMMFSSMIEGLNNYNTKLREVRKGQDNFVRAGLAPLVSGFAVTGSNGDPLSLIRVLENAAAYVGYTQGQGALTPAQKARLAQAGGGALDAGTASTIGLLIPDMNRMKESIQNADGALKAYADEYSKGLNSKTADLTQNFRSLIAQIDVFLPILSKLAGYLNDFLDMLKGFFGEYPVVGGVVDVAAVAGGSYLGWRGLKGIGGRLAGRGAAAVAGGALGAEAVASDAILYSAGFGAPTLTGTATMAGGAAAGVGGLATIVASVLGATVVVAAVGAVAMAIYSDMKAKEEHERWMASISDPAKGMAFLNSLPRTMTGSQFRTMIAGGGFPLPSIDDSLLTAHQGATPQFDVDAFYAQPADTATSHSADYSTSKINIYVSQKPGESMDTLASRIITKANEAKARSPKGRE